MNIRKTILSNILATASGNYDAPVRGTSGSIIITTSADFNGTTSTAALKGSNDGVKWADVAGDDGETPVTAALTAADAAYVWQLKAVLFSRYRIVYDKGDATTGTVNAEMLTK